MLNLRGFKGVLKQVFWVVYVGRNNIFRIGKPIGLERKFNGKPYGMCLISNANRKATVRTMWF